MNDYSALHLDNRNNLSIDFSKHPMRLASEKLRMDYYQVLSYFVFAYDTSELTKHRMLQYSKLLLHDKRMLQNKKIEQAITSIVSCPIMRWRNKYRYWLLTDIALVIQNADGVKKIYEQIIPYLSKRQSLKYQLALDLLYSGQINYNSIPFDDGHFLQCHNNNLHKQKQLLRIVVTANMSAGKSTFINALVGQPVARTSQEVCTGNISFISNKSFDDGSIGLITDKITLDATHDDLFSFSWDNPIYIFSYFESQFANKYQVCIVDTPGVNSSINRNHGRITKKYLKEEHYDKVIYILNANKLGTDEEINYLKWMSKNINEKKIIFVLNKIDDFNQNEDNIAASIDGVRNDLISLGFNNPILCPLSSYFALLLKMKSANMALSDDEQDEYDVYIKKFSKPEYDLSEYYDIEKSEQDSSNYTLFKKRCGMYGVEKIIFGGN